MKYLTFFVLLFLCSCQQEEKNYSWYMQHPLELQQASLNCQTNEGHGNDPAKCEMILHAAVNMSAIVSQLQKDPEKFGEGVLNAEQRLAELSIALNNARQDQLYKAKKEYLEQELEVKTRLAVLGLASPE